MPKKKNKLRYIFLSVCIYMPSHVAICWCPEADIIRELEWYICCRIYAAVKQGLSFAELSPCHAVLMQS